MPKFRDAKISFKRDADGKGSASFDVMYHTHDAACGVASVEFIQEIINDFMPKVEVKDTDEGSAE